MGFIYYGARGNHIPFVLINRTHLEVTNILRKVDYQKAWLFKFALSEKSPIYTKKRIHNEELELADGVGLIVSVRSFLVVLFSSSWSWIDCWCFIRVSSASVVGVIWTTFFLQEPTFKLPKWFDWVSQSVSPSKIIWVPSEPVPYRPSQSRIIIDQPNKPVHHTHNRYSTAAWRFTYVKTSISIIKEQFSSHNYVTIGL